MAVKFGRPAAIAAGVLAVVISVVCLRLGFWQLDRLEQRRALNAAIIQGKNIPEVVLDAALLDSIAVDPASFEHRAVRVTGTFESPSFLVRGRALEGRPGVHLFSPLRLPDDGLVIVNQGWLPSPDAATADPRPYALQGAQTLRGRLDVLPHGSDEVVRSQIPLPGYPVTSYLRLDRDALSSDLGQPVAPVVLRLTERPADAAELPVPIPPPSLDEGSHLGYAIQWFSFSAISLGGFLIVALRRRREA